MTKTLKKTTFILGLSALLIFGFAYFHTAHASNANCPTQVFIHTQDAQSPTGCYYDGYGTNGHYQSENTACLVDTGQYDSDNSSTAQQLEYASLTQSGNSCIYHNLHGVYGPMDQGYAGTNKNITVTLNPQS